MCRDFFREAAKPIYLSLLAARSSLLNARANHEPRRQVLRNRNSPNPAVRRKGTQKGEPYVSALPPANPLVPGVACPGLLPIRFGLRPFLELCHNFDRALAELEARYPSTRPVLTLQARNKRLRRRPK